MKYVKTKGCTNLDYMNNEIMRKEMDVIPLHEGNITVRNKWILHVEKMNETDF